MEIEEKCGKIKGQVKRIKVKAKRKRTKIDWRKQSKKNRIPYRKNKWPTQSMKEWEIEREKERKWLKLKYKIGNEIEKACIKYWTIFKKKKNANETIIFT